MSYSPEKQREYMQDYYKSHPEKWPLVHRPGAGTNAMPHVNPRPLMDPKERWRRQAFRRAKNRCLRTGTTFSITLDDMPTVPNQCPCCGVGLVVLATKPGQKGVILKDPDSYLQRPSMDKIFPAKGYVSGNVIWVCIQCNVRMSDSSSETLYRLAQFREACEKSANL